MLTTLVRSLVEFAAGLRARVVAEGVETAGEADVPRGLGVDYGQGWHFGRPAVPEPAPVLPVPRAAQEPGRTSGDLAALTAVAGRSA